MDIYCNGKSLTDLPEPIARLNELAYNLWWVWQADARELFRMWDYPSWRSTRHNPVKMLRNMTEADKENLAKNIPFRRKLDKLMMRFDAEMENGFKWYTQTHPELKGRPIAYFSAEFGLHNSLPIYSGGLGILSGDHCKEASDLGVPLVGVGFMYPQGYFRQLIPPHGWQEAVYQALDFEDAPILPVLQNGERLVVPIQLDTRQVYVGVWCIKVGRMKIFLMDTNIEANAPWDRELTARLYGGDQEMRIQQEVILGIGGVRVLRKLGIEPAAWHMNEGHSAFMVMERMRELVQSGMDFSEAKEVVFKTSAFTTHTPVPAGHDAFPFHLLEKYFWHYWDDMGLDRDGFMQLGAHQEEWGANFNMTVLAMKNAAYINGVSKLHGKISNEMWQQLWPDVESPILSITNGVHVPTWITGEMDNLLNRYLGPDWIERHDEPALWEQLSDIPDGRFWELKQDLKRKMFSSIWDRTRRRWIEGDAGPTQLMISGMLLDPEALTIGFARRFATYKRATLIFRDIERLKRILLDTHRPVQLIFAGKAHPADEPGKHLIQAIVNLAQDHTLGGRIAFVQDYDMNLARFLVQGVDVWLNTPRRPREASGTSGQKAGLNGTPNFSVLDGWWPEAYNGANGWAIGGPVDIGDHEAQDAADAESIYRALEEEIVPLYYQRDADGVPRGWVQVMKESMRTVAPNFSMRRMLKEYVQLIYAPAIRATIELEKQ